MKRILLIASQLLICLNLFGTNVDSLFTALKKANDKEKLSIYEELCIAYYSIDLDSAGLFAEKKLELAKKLKNYEHTSISLKLIGNVHNIKGEVEDAIVHYENALKIALEHDIKDQIGFIINNIGAAYEYSGNYEKSLSYYQQALSIDSANSNLKGIGSMLSNIGNTYFRMGKYEESILYLKKGLKIAENINDNALIASTCNVLGLSYKMNSDFENASNYFFLALKKSEEQKDFYTMVSILFNLGTLQKEWGNNSKALIYFNQAKRISKKNKNIDIYVKSLMGIASILNIQNKPDSAIIIFNIALKEYGLRNDPQTVCEIYQNIGNSYMLKKDYKQAKRNYEKSYSVIEKTSAVDDIATSLNYLGEVSYLLKEYRAAINYCIRSNQLSVSREIKGDNYYTLSKIFEALNKPTLALENYKLYSEVRDSVFTIEKHKQIQDLQTKYETEKKEQQIESLSKEKEIEILKNEQSRYYIISLLGILFILVLVAILFLRNNKLKASQKTIELEQRLLRTQMNPHFIFNAISCIQEYIIDKRPMEAGAYLSDFAKLMRSILSNSATEFISLEDEIETLKHYLELQKIRFPEKLEYKIIVPEDLEIDELAIPPMLSQPFIENAIEHGIAKKTDGVGEVKVEFSVKNGSLLLQIQDNGVGLQVVEDKNKKHQSMATKITQSRINNFKKAYKKNVRFEISNVLDSKNQVLGVLVVFELPKKYLS